MLITIIKMSIVDSLNLLSKNTMINNEKKKKEQK